MEKSVFVVVDMQKGLFARGVYKKESLMHNINMLIDAFRVCDIPVIFFRHINSSFSQKNTEEWQLCDELRKEPATWFSTKATAVSLKKRALFHC